MYTGSCFNENVWERYRPLCDELVVVFRKEDGIYTVSEAKQAFNQFDNTKMKSVILPDIYRPIKNIFNFKMKKKIKDEIRRQVEKADKVIIRSLGNLYTNTALKYVRKFQKPYLVEVTGFAKESLWYHSLRGKIMAIPKELQYRYLMKKVPYALYVTEEALQKRYQCAGRMCGCSDIELINIEEKPLHKKSIIKKRYILGTAAALDYKAKGQKYVLYAIAYLRKKGLDCWQYHLAGAGEGKALKRLVKKLDLEDCVRFMGSLPHDVILEWMDTIDIYVQPSMSEGLSRAVIEAMSRGCPIICSDVGGNYELVERENLFRKADYRQLADILENFVRENKFEEESNKSYEKAKKYEKAVLDKRRNAFYQEFLNHI